MAEPQHRRFSAHDVERMLETGILDEDEPIELLDGELILGSPQTPKHAALVEIVRRALESAHGDDVHTRTHSPIDAGPDARPEPDIALVRGKPEDFFDRHPRGDEVILAVEIAISDPAADRAKARIYARAAVPEVWIVDLVKNRIEVRSRPRSSGGYAWRRVLGSKDRAAIPGTEAEIEVGRLVG